MFLFCRGVIERGESTSNIDIMLEKVNQWMLLPQYFERGSLDRLLAGLESTVTELSCSAHRDTTKWLDVHLKREDAMQRLTGKATGTFVIRYSSEGTQYYALSIVYETFINKSLWIFINKFLFLWYRY